MVAMGGETISTMADREFLQRIDRHMDRGNALMERGNTLMGEIREEMRLSREEARLSREQAARHAELYSDLRQFIRDMNARMNRAMREQVAELRKVGDALGGQTAELRELRMEQRELRQDSRAQTQALLRMLDRFDRLDPGEAGAG
jgi:chromosome segregation ATPase